ncbi:hypothetical protein BJX65DRAFT_158730 [Aspergillus insuetus]
MYDFTYPNSWFSSICPLYILHWGVWIRLDCRVTVMFVRVAWRLPLVCHETRPNRHGHGVQYRAPGTATNGRFQSKYIID